MNFSLRERDRERKIKTICLATKLPPYFLFIGSKNCGSSCRSETFCANFFTTFYRSELVWEKRVNEQASFFNKCFRRLCFPSTPTPSQMQKYIRLDLMNNTQTCKRHAHFNIAANQGAIFLKVKGQQTVNESNLPRNND